MSEPRPKKTRTEMEQEIARLREELEWKKIAEEPLPSPAVAAVPVPTAEDIASAMASVHETSLDRVYRENGITARDVAQQPRMTKALGYLGGLEVAAEYLRGSEDADAQKFIEVYDRNYGNRDFLEFEGMCAAAGVNGKKIFGVLVAEATVDSEQTVQLLTSIKMPEVVHATAEMALMPHGHREKTLMAKASGWLPRPKGTQTSIQINTSVRGGNGGTAPTALPAFDQDIRALGERFQALNTDTPKLLEGK